MSNVTLTFLGAAGTVTGSRFLIKSDSGSFMVDAGLFQGPKNLEDKNWDDFPFDPAQIDAIFLSHCHLDHSGYLPLLVKQGFKGPIYSTLYTKKLAEVILRDSAFLQVEDAKYAAKKGYSKHKNPTALYDIQDVEATMSQFVDVPFRSEREISPSVKVTFHPSGHILGAAFITLAVEDKKLLFTSDMGRLTHPILIPPDPAPVSQYDALITESTYGDRIHGVVTTEFADAINGAVKRGGSILIPAFAVDRTEVILLTLSNLISAGKIPRLPIYVDSPMALTSLNYYREAISCQAPEIRRGIFDQVSKSDPFDPGSLHQMLTVDESKSLNDITESSIIISASGMATGGRVVHHLANMLPDSRNTVVLVGFQASGSRGRMLQMGNAEIRIHGQMVPVKAAVANVDTFSVHADAQELTNWLRPLPTPKQVFIVHGEPESSQAFASRLKTELHWDTELPLAGNSYVI